MIPDLFRSPSSLCSLWLCGKNAFTFLCCLFSANLPTIRRIGVSGTHTRSNRGAQRHLPCFHAVNCAVSAPTSLSPACNFSDSRKFCGRLNDTQMHIRGQHHTIPALTGTTGFKDFSSPSQESHTPDNFHLCG